MEFWIIYDFCVLKTNGSTIALLSDVTRNIIIYRNDYFDGGHYNIFNPPESHEYTFIRKRIKTADFIRTLTTESSSQTAVVFNLIKSCFRDCTLVMILENIFFFFEKCFCQVFPQSNIQEVKKPLKIVHYLNAIRETKWK